MLAKSASVKMLRCHIIMLIFFLSILYELGMIIQGISLYMEPKVRFVIKTF
jgi:hypothetical protein